MNTISIMKHRLRRGHEHVDNLLH